MIAYKNDRAGLFYGLGYVVEMPFAEYWFATRVEVERFADAMGLPVRWV